MPRNVFSAFLGLILVPAPHGALAETLLTKEGLAEDVQILRRAMVQLHPGLYRFNTPEGIEAAFLAFPRPTAQLHGGPACPNPWNQNEATAGATSQLRPGGVIGDRLLH